MQADITRFQTQFNGPFPFSTDGVIVGIPSASFEEEMQTKITFARRLGSDRTSSTTRTCTSGGATTSPRAVQPHLLQGGLRGHVGGLTRPRTAATNAGGLGTPAGDAAFEASLVTRFNGTYNSHQRHTVDGRAVEPAVQREPVRHTTPTRGPGRAYIALRAILGKANFNAASQGDPDAPTAAARSPQPQQIAVYKKWMPNKSTGVLRQARRVLQAVVGHGLRRLAGGGQQAADHGPGPGRRRLL